MKKKKSYREGVLYIAISITEANIIKIGSTQNFEKRMQQIKNYRDNHFKKNMCFIPYFAIKTNKCNQLEDIMKPILHSRIGNTNCYRIEANKVIPLFQKLEGEQVFPEISYKRKYEELMDTYTKCISSYIKCMKEVKECEKVETEIVKHMYEESLYTLQEMKKQPEERDVYSMLNHKLQAEAHLTDIIEKISGHSSFFNMI